jgi:hypothetical protein
MAEGPGIIMEQMQERGLIMPLDGALPILGTAIEDGQEMLVEKFFSNLRSASTNLLDSESSPPQLLPGPADFGTPCVLSESSSASSRDVFRTSYNTEPRRPSGPISAVTTQLSTSHPGPVVQFAQQSYGQSESLAQTDLSQLETDLGAPSGAVPSWKFRAQPKQYQPG